MNPICFISGNDDGEFQYAMETVSSANVQRHDHSSKIIEEGQRNQEDSDEQGDEDYN